MAELSFWIFRFFLGIYCLVWGNFQNSKFSGFSFRWWKLLVLFESFFHFSGDSKFSGKCACWKIQGVKVNCGPDW
jgi:hypothetical protein